VVYKTTNLAPGKWSATATVPQTMWQANDGHLTLLPNGTLEVRYPSNAIVEYWQREDGRGAELANRLQVASATPAAPVVPRHRRSEQCYRGVYLIIRKAFGNEKIPYHWAIGIEEELGSEYDNLQIYEVNGSMGVYGPRGLIAASSPMLCGPISGTRLDQFEGILDLNLGIRTKLGTLGKGRALTQKTHNDIVKFTREWVLRHPIYKFEGPNCQTYTEDLFNFLTGCNLAYPKIAELQWQVGPEADARTVWIGKR